MKTLFFPSLSFETTFSIFFSEPISFEATPRIQTVEEGSDQVSEHFKWRPF